MIGGNDMKLDEIDRVGTYVAEKLDADATTIWGARIDPKYEGKLQVIAIMTGVKSPWILGQTQAGEAGQEGFDNALGIPMSN